MCDALPIREEVHVATRLFNAQNAGVRVNDVDEQGIAALQPVQLLAFVEAWPGRIQAGYSRQQNTGQIGVVAARVAANVGAQRMACVCV